MLYQLSDLKPRLEGEGHFIAPSASVIGDVTLHNKVSIWFGTVVRGDVEKIVIGANSNIQDLCVLHADPGKPLVIGAGVTVGHKVMLHGCEIGDSTMIGMNAVVLNGARIGANCIIGASALVTENSVIPDGSLVLGAPAKVVREISGEQRKLLALSAQGYAQKGELYNSELALLMQDEDR